MSLVKIIVRVEKVTARLRFETAVALREPDGLTSFWKRSRALLLVFKALSLMPFPFWLSRLPGLAVDDTVGKGLQPDFHFLLLTGGLCH